MIYQMKLSIPKRFQLYLAYSTNASIHLTMRFPDRSSLFRLDWSHVIRSIMIALKMLPLYLRLIRCSESSGSETIEAVYCDPVGDAKEAPPAALMTKIRGTASAGGAPTGSRNLKHEMVSCGESFNNFVSNSFERCPHIVFSSFPCRNLLLERVDRFHKLFPFWVISATLFLEQRWINCRIVHLMWLKQRCNQVHQCTNKDPFTIITTALGALCARIL